MALPGWYSHILPRLLNAAFLQSGNPLIGSWNKWACIKRGDTLKCFKIKGTTYMVNTWILGSSYIEGSKLVATWTWVMEVLFLASGEILTALDQDVFDGKTAREVKQISRFRQRLFAEDGFREIQDDVRFLDRLPCKCSCLCWSSCCQMLKRTNAWFLHAGETIQPA